VRQKVLLIDDSEDIHDLVAACLADEPVELNCALTSEAGLAAASGDLPDLILLDVEMNCSDGFHICRRLKDDPITRDIPVVFLTSGNAMEQKVQGLELGAVDYVTKPFAMPELRARVRAALRTKHLMDLLAKRALIDGLTGLANRASLEQRLAQELSLSRRTKRPLACVMLDVDHFKKVNDTYGHAFGDEVLRSVAQTLMSGCRTEDLVARYGGEEFALLLPNTGGVGAAELAERLREAVASIPVTHRDTPVNVTCSFGVSEWPRAVEPSLVEAADKALYQAKQSGRNRVVSALDSNAGLRAAV
jgi:diguanylate cyclase (GGDEF)-like protein